MYINPCLFSYNDNLHNTLKTFQKTKHKLHLYTNYIDKFAQRKHISQA